MVAAIVVAAAGTVIYLYLNPNYQVIAVPRPNSGEYTSSEATKLLGTYLENCSAISGEHNITRNWNDTLKLRVHVMRDGSIRVVDSGGNESYGILALENAMINFPRWGGATGALMTSDTDGWQSPEKQQVIDRLFQPAWQIYVVKRR